MGAGAVCPGACGGQGESGTVAGIGVLAEMARGGCGIGAVGTYLSSGICLIGVGPVGVTGIAGVAVEMIGDSGRAGCIAASLPAALDGTGDTFESDCCGGWLRYVGLFIISRELPLPLGDGELTVSSDG